MTETAAPEAFLPLPPPVVEGERATATGTEREDAAASAEAPAEEAAVLPREAISLEIAKPAERPRSDARVVEPVREALREMPATPGRHAVTLTLTPDSLGELRVRITTTPDDGVRATILATTPEAKASLEIAVDGLRQTLAERGLRLEGLTVALMQDVPATTAAANPPGGGDGRQAAMEGGQSFLGSQGRQEQAFRQTYAAYQEQSEGRRNAPFEPPSGAGLTMVRQATPGRVNLLA